MPGTYKPIEHGRITAAVTRLIAANGGAANAQHKTDVRVGDSELGRYQDNNEHKMRHMPVDIVLALERHCGEPIVTEFLAAEAGCVVMRLPRGVPESWAMSIQRLTDEHSDVIRELCRALDGDGEIDAVEAGRAIDEIDEDVKALATLRAQLTRIRDRESGP